MIVQINEENPQPYLIKKVTEVLKNGGVIIYPTDTVYAYGCDINCKQAIEKIYRIKNIKRTKPLSFIFTDISHISEYVRNMSNESFKIMKKTLPGPYTYIFQASKLVPKSTLTKQKTVGVRIPDNKIPYEIVKSLGHPIISASVNTDTGDYIIEPEELEKKYINSVDLVIDCGKKVPEPSTIVDFSSGKILLLREGKAVFTP